MTRMKEQQGGSIPPSLNYKRGLDYPSLKPLRQHDDLSRCDLLPCPGVISHPDIYTCWIDVFIFFFQFFFHQKTREDEP